MLFTRLEIMLNTRDSALKNQKNYALKQSIRKRHNETIVETLIENQEELRTLSKLIFVNKWVKRAVIKKNKKQLFSFDFQDKTILQKLNQILNFRVINKKGGGK